MCLYFRKKIVCHRLFRYFLIIFWDSTCIISMRYKRKIAYQSDLSYRIWPRWIPPTSCWTCKGYLLWCLIKILSILTWILLAGMQVRTIKCYSLYTFIANRIIQSHHSAIIRWSLFVFLFYSYSSTTWYWIGTIMLY